ncbi:trichothecene 3-O-acetyltransferase-like protein [Apiospora saccharicola]
MEPLHVMNQVAPREYVNFTLCFPFEDDKEKEAVNHLQRCVDDCVQQNPHLAGTIREQDTPQRHTLAYVQPEREQPRGTVVVEKLRPSKFEAAHGDVTTSSSFTYEKLRAGGFSPGLFFNDPFYPAGDPAAAHGGDVPVLCVCANFVPGGLLLGVFIHHAMADGGVATALIDDLAARSCGKTVLPRRGFLPKSQYLPLGRPSAEFGQHVDSLREAKGLSSEEITPEMQVGWTTKDSDGKARFSIRNSLPANTVPRVGKIFHFSKAKLTNLSQALATARAVGSEGGNGKPPSTNVALMALIWAYVTKARMRAVRADDWSAPLGKGKKKRNDSSSRSESEKDDMSAQLTIVATWKPSPSLTTNKKGGGGRGSGFGPETLDALEDFCGNVANLCPIAALPTTQLLWRAATATATATAEKRNRDAAGTRSRRRGEEGIKALAEITTFITHTIDSLDAEFVRRRAALLENLEDITAIDMDHDFEAPQSVLFNSHRFLAGADTGWDIPGLFSVDSGGGGAGVGVNHSIAGVPNSGVGGSTRRKPEIIRKGRKAWGQGTVLVMPSSQESDVLEVMLAMSGNAMEGLCRDEGWRGWVERIVD